MEITRIFDGIKDDELEKMLTCFGAKHKKFTPGNNLSTRRYGEPRPGVILSGEADLVRYDYDGYRNILEHLAPGDVFGEIFMQIEGADELAIVCEKKCEVLYMDYKNVIKRCPNACSFHSLLVDNILQIMAQKVQKLRTHLEVLSQRTLRTKLLTYFKMLSNQAGSESFTLPFSLADLADYLYVDRSAMLREMKNLREENLIVSRGKHITLT